MHLGIAVDLARGGEEEARPLPLGETQGVVRPVRPRLQRVERQPQVVDRTGQGGQVVDEVQLVLHRDPLAHVVVHERERVIPKVGDVRERACLEVVETENAVALLEQCLAEVGAEEPGATGDEGRGHRGRCYRPFRTRTGMLTNS